MRRISTAVASVLLTLTTTFAVPASGEQKARVAEDRKFLNAFVVAPPSPVLATDKRRHLVYEIVMDNPTRARVRLDRVVARDAVRDKEVAQWRGRAIKALMFRVDGAPTPTRSLAPGQVGVLLLDVQLRSSDPQPERLKHRFELSIRRQGIEPRRVSMTGIATKVSSSAPTSISPPLAEGDLGVIGCCGPPFAHRLALLQTIDRIVVAQRYAIDFIQLDDQLSTYAGDPTLNESYFIYGDEVIAVAAGEIVATRNDMADSTPPGLPSNVGFNDVAGNFITQDLGDGRFALYAHLQPGSVLVEPGEHVEAGQVIGLVGNSGNSAEPHLHFHLMNGPGGPSNLEADGVPYVFDSFQREWVVTGLDANPPSPARERAPLPLQRTMQFPLTGDILSFGSME